MKKLTFFFLIFVYLLLIPISSSANHTFNKTNLDINLNKYETILDDFYNESNIYVNIYLTYFSDESSVQQFLKKEHNNTTTNNVQLLINLNSKNRKLYTYAYSNASKFYNDYFFDNIRNDMIPFLKAGNYEEGIDLFVNSIIDNYSDNNQTISNVKTNKFISHLSISVIVSSILCFFIFQTSKQPISNNKILDKNITITNKKTIFLGTTRTSRKINSSSNSNNKRSGGSSSF